MLCAYRPNIGTKIPLSIRCVPNLLPAAPIPFAALTSVFECILLVLRSLWQLRIAGTGFPGAAKQLPETGCFYRIVM